MSDETIYPLCEKCGGYHDAGYHTAVRCLLLPEGWTPTSANINALPEPLRRYVHDLETRCDPAGEIQERVALRENVARLTAALAAAEQRATDATDGLRDALRRHGEACEREEQERVGRCAAERRTMQHIEERIWVDATPDAEYPLRILRAHLDDNTGSTCTSDPPALAEAMNAAAAKRAVILRAAIERLRHGDQAEQERDAEHEAQCVGLREALGCCRDSFEGTFGPEWGMAPGSTLRATVDRALADTATLAQPWVALLAKAEAYGAMAPPRGHVDETARLEALRTAVGALRAAREGK